MAKPKGLPKSGGRKKGTPNKQTAAVKDMVLAALSGVGGVAYLKRQAEENPAAFMTLVGKIIPTQIVGDVDNPIVVTRIELTAPKHDDTAHRTAAEADPGLQRLQ